MTTGQGQPAATGVSRTGAPVDDAARLAEVRRQLAEVTAERDEAVAAADLGMAEIRRAWQAERTALAGDVTRLDGVPRLSPEALSQLLSERAASQGRMDQLEERVARAEQQAAQMKLARQELAGQLAVRQARVLDLEGERDGLMAEVTGLRGEIDRIMVSWSMRLTRPVRGFRALFRRRR